jgi:CRP/FNR family transcriptional regulator
VFQVEQGVVAVYKTLVDGRRRIVDFAYPGDLMGLGAFNEHVLSAQAVSSTRVRCLSASALEHATAADPHLAIKLYRAACQELATTRELLVTIGQTKALERVATFLLALHRRSGGPCDGIVTLAMRRSDIGDLLGLTIESVSRMLTSYVPWGSSMSSRGAR